LAEGKEINLEELEIHYVMGSGNHARTFLHRNARGQLIELPLGWYAEKGGVFDMNPGFDTVAPPTRRKIDDDCMACHNAYPAGDSPPEGIDCARCHGDGARHASIAAARGARVEAIREAIVNPARLPPARRDEVCYQCHLETTSTPLPGRIRRYDRPPYSYKPGEPLSSAFLYFDHAPGTGREEKFEIVSAVYRMRQSACFVKSGRMTCTTCHDAHGRPRDARTAPCLACHEPAHNAKSDCSACHMPRRRADDVVRVIMTDHKIQRMPPPGDLIGERREPRRAESQQYRGEVVPYATSPDPLPPVASLYAAVAQLLHGSNLREGIPRLESEIAKAPVKVAEAHVALGNAWRESGRFSQAVAALEQAARIRPDSAAIERNLGVALLESGVGWKAAARFQRAIELDPADAASWYQLALIDSASGRTRDAVAKARRAIALDPDLLDARNSLAVNLSLLGDAVGAEAAFREALRIDPYFATAHANLARQLGLRGELPGALHHFERAIRYRPLFAPDRYDYAVTLARTSRSDDALAQAESAVNIAPDMAAARLLLGTLHARAGRLEPARREIEAAVKLEPGSARARLELARVLLGQGQREAAIPHLDALIRGPDAEAANQARRIRESLPER
jgi:tetratricopeptide (TPR) repeat protein